MLVNHLMSTQPAIVTSRDSLDTVVQVMNRRKVRRVLVVDDGRLVGLVARSDVLSASAADTHAFSAAARGSREMQRGVGEIMSAHLHTVSPDEPIEAAAQLMLRYKIGALPVLRREELVGLVTESDLFRALVATMGAASGTRITIDLLPGEDAIAFAVRFTRGAHLTLDNVCLFSHDGRTAAVLKVHGEEPAHLIEDLWDTGHKVVSVVRS